MFIKQTTPQTGVTEMVVELDRVEIALLFCLLQSRKPKDAVALTTEFLEAQGAPSGK